MMKDYKFIIAFSVLIFLFTGCHNTSKETAKVDAGENKHAKQMLQGIWINNIEENVVFKIHGDTIYYPDSTSIPVAFKVVGDTLILSNTEKVKYAIIKQTAHLFVFQNQYGDKISLEKSDNPEDNFSFEKKQTVALNQKQIVKRDTILTSDKDRYHLYVQVNPTTYKIIKSTYTDEGVEVGNIYYDNIVHVSVFKGANRLFSRDFHKEDFQKYIPSQFYSQCLLSDIIFDNISKDAVEFKAALPIPDTITSYIIKITISFDGTYTLSV